MKAKLNKLFSSIAKNEWENKSEKKQKPLKTIDILKSIPIFSTLSKKELKIISDIFHKREYSKDETVCLQGDPGLGMYVVLNGEVEVFVNDENNRKNSLAILGSGEFFGELSLIDNSPRSATVIATKKSELLGFFQPDLIEINRKNPSMGLKIIFKIAELLAERLRQTNEKLAMKESSQKKILTNSKNRSKNENSSTKE